MNDNIPVGYDNEGEFIGFNDPRAVEDDPFLWIKSLGKQNLTEVEEEVALEAMRDEKSLQAEDIVFNPKNLN